MDKELLHYIDSQRQSGFSEEQIRQALMQAGHEAALIDSLVLGVDSQTSLEETSSNISTEKVNIPQQSESAILTTNKVGRGWLKWLLIVFGLLAIAFIALFLLSRPLSSGSDALKNRALDTLIEKGEEAFMENGEVTTNGLCVFMIFNQSYLEAVSDPTWEFQCFDSDTAFAGEVKLNDGSYRCRDSAGTDITSDRSIIYGPECLQESDPRLNDDMEFPTSYVFNDIPKIVSEEGLEETDNLSFDCGLLETTGDWSSDLELSQDGMACLSKSVLNDCSDSYFKLIGGTGKEAIYGVGLNGEGSCIMEFSYNFQGRTSGSCDIAKILSESVNEEFCTNGNSMSLCEQRSYDLEDWKAYHAEDKNSLRGPDKIYYRASEELSRLVAGVRSSKNEQEFENHGCVISEY